MSNRRVMGNTRRKKDPFKDDEADATNGNDDGHEEDAKLYSKG